MGPAHDSSKDFIICSAVSYMRIIQEARGGIYAEGMVRCRVLISVLRSHVQRPIKALASRKPSVIIRALLHIDLYHGHSCIRLISLL